MLSLALLGRLNALFRRASLGSARLEAKSGLVPANETLRLVDVAGV